MDGRRALDLGLGGAMLVVALPVLAGVALALRLTGDRGPFLYRATRVGEGGRQFTLLKVRTMRAGAAGPGVTLARDARVTPLGRLLRRYRIDELPQLVNVVRGEMSLIGPRPEDPRYVDLSNPVQRRVLAVRPGITGPTQLAFRDEAAWLVGPGAERRYREELLPEKLSLDDAYVARHTALGDLILLGRTVVALLPRAIARPRFAR